VKVGSGSVGGDVLVGGSFVGPGPEVAEGWGVGLGSGDGSVLTGSWEVGVGVRFKPGVAVFLG